MISKAQLGDWSRNTIYTKNVNSLNPIKEEKNRIRRNRFTFRKTIFQIII